MTQLVDGFSPLPTGRDNLACADLHLNHALAGAHDVNAAGDTYAPRIRCCRDKFRGRINDSLVDASFSRELGIRKRDEPNAAAKDVSIVTDSTQQSCVKAIRVSAPLRDILERGAE